MSVSGLDAVDRLPGLGPSARAALAEHGVSTVADLVWLAPVAWDDMRAPVALADAVGAAKAARERGDVGRPPRVVAAARVKSAGVVPIRGRRCVRVVLADRADAACTLHAFWFFMAQGVLAAAKPGADVLFVGRVVVEAAKPPRSAHPEIAADVAEARVVRARYPRLGVPEAALRKAVPHALDALGDDVPDPVPPSIRRREGMPDARAIVRAVHARDGAPPSGADERAFVERLAWAEAFTRAWERLARDDAAGAAPAPALPDAPHARAALERELGFALTRDQRGAIAEIAADLASPRPMRRLLLGDVGTGKTAVALAAVAQCVAAGKQAAILAPTSVLAEQYLDATAPLVRATAARVAFIAAGTPAAARRRDEEALRSGDAAVAIGTHALLAEGLAIPALALVVVDEQQRLGVAQRLALVAKGKRPHVLSLSATPIPRTLALALRGELATSTLRERPAGRRAPKARLAAKSELEGVLAEVRDAAARGQGVFWVVPRIEAESDEDDGAEVASVVARAEALGRALHDTKVTVLHGGMKAKDKRAAMRAFRSGEARVLVGTTVVEVGLDVPSATLMVIEDAERFGLAQLHQLRGRVGRGAEEGACVLLHGEPLEGAARARLEALRDLDDGEAVARADLELRGAGDLGGTRQHGDEEELLYLDPSATYAWLACVDDDARRAKDDDPRLAAPEHRVLASLVRRLGHAIAVREEAG